MRRDDDDDDTAMPRILRNYAIFLKSQGENPEESALPSNM